MDIKQVRMTLRRLMLSVLFWIIHGVGLGDDVTILVNAEPDGTVAYKYLDSK